jgi:hypothetical protein
MSPEVWFLATIPGLWLQAWDTGQLNSLNLKADSFSLLLIWELSPEHIVP